MIDIFKFLKKKQPPFKERSPTGGSVWPHNFFNISPSIAVVAPIYTRIAIDTSVRRYLHGEITKNGMFLKEKDSPLNKALKFSPNIDQTPEEFIQHLVYNMLRDGVVAVVPVDTVGEDIYSLRVGKILEFFPSEVKVALYDARNGRTKDVVVKKTSCAIIRNPFYYVMNDKNSTLRRLMDKIALLDMIDKESGAGRLDLIIQLPYAVKSERRQEEAQKRLDMIAKQLKDSRYGIAYTDGTERVIQLNRPAENNLLTQIDNLTEMLYSQLGVPKQVFYGIADNNAENTYQNKTITPIANAITASFSRSFISPELWGKEQIMSIRRPFVDVPPTMLAEFADKFTRNEILSSNEVRGIIGFLPSDDPDADVLKNKNLRSDTQKEDKKEINDRKI